MRRRPALGGIDRATPVYVLSFVAKEMQGGEHRRG